MKLRGLQAGTLPLLLAILWQPVAAQVQIAPSTYIRLTADASVGYVHSNVRGGVDSLNYGLRADLNGYFYHPNFLQFNFSPYYNQGREYSVPDYIAGDKGFTADLNLFTGSNIPFYLNYSQSKTDSGLYGVVGTEASVVGEGSNDNLNLSWNVRFPRWPTLQLGYLRSSSDYRVFGENESFGSGHSSGYTVGTQYNLLGFALSGNFYKQDFRQTLPRVLIGNLQRADTFTRQDLYQFALNRRVVKAGFFDLTASRSHWNTDALRQSQNRRYDALSGGLTMRPQERISTGVRVNYTTDLSALLLGSILPGGLGSQGGNPAAFLIDPRSIRTRFLSTTGWVGYDLNRHMSVQSRVRHGDSHLTNNLGHSTFAWDNAVNFRYTIRGSRLTAGYTTGLYDYQNGLAETSSQGHTGNLGLAKMIRGWDYAGSFQYSTSSIDALLPGNTDTLSAEFSATGNVKTWRLVAAFRYEDSETIFSTQTTNRRHSYRLSASRGRLHLNSQLQLTSGLSIIGVAGPRPASVQQIAAAASELERLLIPVDSSSISFTGSYQIGRKTTMHGGWVRMHYRSLQSGANRENQLNQTDFHIRHMYRRLDLRAGYRGYHQQFAGLFGPFNSNSIYFQVSRHFDVF